MTAIIEYVWGTFYVVEFTDKSSKNINNHSTTTKLSKTTITTFPTVSELVIQFYFRPLARKLAREKNNFININKEDS